ncbi:MAG: GMC family oxidoreductase, partial [Pseudomonadota bacterium]
GGFEIEADTVVLACGAVANARLLLLSDGMGNQSDCVGRYFMGQPFCQDKKIIQVKSDSYLNFGDFPLVRSQTTPSLKCRSIYGLLSPSAESLKTHGISSLWLGLGGTDIYYNELLPNRDARITLSHNQSDPVFGQPETRVDWHLSDQSESNYNKQVALFRQSVTQLAKDNNKTSAPDVTALAWSEFSDSFVFNGHHLGTTRMSADPAHGVVDKNLKVHSMNNVYVAGSSVWASAGISNPTLSIIAFSIRLARHLAQQLRS